MDDVRLSALEAKVEDLLQQLRDLRLQLQSLQDTLRRIDGGQ